jgi:hypothetical protein
MKSQVVCSKEEPEEPLRTDEESEGWAHLQFETVTATTTTEITDLTSTHSLQIPELPDQETHLISHLTFG